MKKAYYTFLNICGLLLIILGFYGLFSIFFDPDLNYPIAEKVASLEIVYLFWVIGTALIFYSIRSKKTEHPTTILITETLGPKAISISRIKISLISGLLLMLGGTIGMIIFVFLPIYQIKETQSLKTLSFRNIIFGLIFLIFYTVTRLIDKKFDKESVLSEARHFSQKELWKEGGEDDE